MFLTKKERTQGKMKEREIKLEEEEKKENPIRNLEMVRRCRDELGRVLEVGFYKCIECETLSQKQRWKKRGNEDLDEEGRSFGIQLRTAVWVYEQGRGHRCAYSFPSCGNYESVAGWYETRLNV